MIRHGDCALVYCTFEKYKQYGVCDIMVPQFEVLWSSKSGIQSWLFVVLDDQQGELSLLLFFNKSHSLMALRFHPNKLLDPMSRSLVVSFQVMCG